MSDVLLLIKASGWRSGIKGLKYTDEVLEKVFLYGFEVK